MLVLTYSDIEIMKVLDQNSSLLVRLVKGQLPLNPLWKKRSYRIKFLLRSYLVYRETLIWLNTLSGYPLLNEILKKQTNLPCKLHRPYLANSMSRKMRHHAITAHYDFLSKQSPQLIKNLYQLEPIILATIKGKAEQPFFLTLESNDKYSREGELTFSICNSDNVVLATLTFAIIDYYGKLTLFIGGFQGSNHKHARELIQKTTKACFGVFPKHLVLQGALSFANYFGIKNILAVTNKTHIYNNFRYRRRNKLRVADYDSYWQSLQSKLIDNQYYQIPYQLKRKQIEDIPSKKRSEYRNRYILLDQLNDDIHHHLSQLE